MGLKEASHAVVRKPYSPFLSLALKFCRSVLSAAAPAAAHLHPEQIFAKRLTLRR